MANKMTIEEMREKIATHTGRKPVSKNPDFLEKRLKDLDQRDKAADLAEAKHGARSTDDPTTVLSVSMPNSVKLATVRIAGGEQIGVSELVRRAVGEYASRRGYKQELEHFPEEG